MSSNLIPSAKVLLCLKQSLRRGVRAYMATVFLVSFICAPCLAADGDEARAPLDKVLAVLRLDPEAASKACLNAMSDVHATERQLKDHENDVGNHPDLDIARDVLESDYQNSAQVCGADAARVCRTDHAVPLQAACIALPGGSAGNP